MKITEFLRSDKKRMGFIVSLLILVIGIIPLIILTYYADPAHPYTIKPTTLISEDGTKIKTLVYTPINLESNVPGIVLAHGYCGNKESMQKVAIELVKREFIVVSIDFRGHGGSGGRLIRDAEGYEQLEMDILAAIDYLNSLGFIDRIGLVGHSMGGGTVARVTKAYPSLINATITMGSIPSLENITSIRNLLMVFGQYEQGYIKTPALNALEIYTGSSNVEFNTLYGDFTLGTAVKAAIGPFSEHLYERQDPVILSEIVIWFESTFNPSIERDIFITAHLHTLFYYISVFGVVCLNFVIILYLKNFIWKDQKINLRKNLIENHRIVKLMLYSIIVGLVGTGFYLVFSPAFIDVLPISSGDQLFAFWLGAAVGFILIYYLFILRKERLGIKGFQIKIRELTSDNLGNSLIYGIVVAVLLIVSISSITQWSESPSFPNIREIGTMIGLTLILFPLLFAKEFYFRTVQGQLKSKNRFKEYFTMLGIGIFMENIVLIPIMIMTWSSPIDNLDFVALSLTVVLGMSIIQQILVTWVYMYSGRNIMGSTIFLCIFYSWMLINFFPFS